MDANCLEYYKQSPQGLDPHAVPIQSSLKNYESRSLGETIVIDEDSIPNLKKTPVSCQRDQNPPFNL